MHEEAVLREKAHFQVCVLVCEMFLDVTLIKMKFCVSASFSCSKLHSEFCRSVIRETYAQIC